MKIPKYIDNALRLRTKYANMLDTQMNIVDDFLDKHGIECDLCDTHTGVEIYCNPSASERRIRDAISKA